LADETRIKIIYNEGQVNLSWPFLFDTAYFIFSYSFSLLKREKARMRVIMKI